MPAGTDATQASSRLAELRQAAARLFALRGYHGTSMSDIGRELGLGAPGLYNHITSKQALLEDICVTAMARARSLQEAALAQRSGHAGLLRSVTEAHVRFVAVNRDEAAVVDREFVHLDGPARLEIVSRRHQYERAFRSLIEDGAAAGDFTVLDPKMAAFAVIELASSVAQWFRESGPWSLDAIAAEYGRYALRLVGHP